MTAEVIELHGRRRVVDVLDEHRKRLEVAQLAEDVADERVRRLEAVASDPFFSERVEVHREVARAVGLRWFTAQVRAERAVIVEALEELVDQGWLR